MSPVVAAVAPSTHSAGGDAALLDVKRGTVPLDTHVSCARPVPEF
jgi:hypothetical protein